MDLRGRVALVTGGGRRVGSELVRALAKQGATVAVHYNESDRGANEVVTFIEKSGGKATAFRADLTEGSASAQLIDDVIGAMGGLDILVNSAASMIRTTFGEINVSDWDRIFALNLRAPFLLSQAAAPMLKRARGTIINIADLAAFETWPGYIPHGLSKAGVVQMTKALAKVLAPDVRVNAIAPGTVLLPDDWSERDEERMIETTPLKRNGSPADVVAAMLFLLDSEYITGETIIVDGGRHVRR